MICNLVGQADQHHVYAVLVGKNMSGGIANVSLPASVI
jgi:hypothetical protein